MVIEPLKMGEYEPLVLPDSLIHGQPPQRHLRKRSERSHQPPTSRSLPRRDRNRSMAHVVAAIQHTSALRWSARLVCRVMPIFTVNCYGVGDERSGAVYALHTHFAQLRAELECDRCGRTVARTCADSWLRAKGVCV